MAAPTAPRKNFITRDHRYVYLGGSFIALLGLGMFYSAPSPDARPFVEVGDQVKKGDTLCIIEAMKVLNEVTAEADGEVLEICVADGDLVEFGSCLMRIG